MASPVSVRALRHHLDEPLPPVDGLGSSAVTPIVDRLVARGHRVTVVTLAPGHEGEPLDLTGERLRVLVGPYRRSGRARDGFATERRAVADGVRRAVRDLRSPAVHAHWSYEFALGALAAEARSLVSFHDWSPRIVRLHPHPYRIVRLGLQLATLRRGRRFTAVSPPVADRMRRWTDAPIEVIPNGVADDAFATEASWSAEPQLLAVAAGFSRWKNIATLLEAFPAVRETVPGARLRLVGDGHGRDEAAERWARGRGLDLDGVEFVGRQSRDEVFRAMAGATALVHPSLEEACPMVVIEAMAHGLPVVGGRASGAVPWVVGDGGALVDVTDAAELASGMAALVTDRERWAEASRAARERASSSFRLDRVVERYEELYASWDQPPG